MDLTELNNQEEVYGQPGGAEQTEPANEVAPVDTQQEAPADPTDLAAAFMAMRKNDKAATQTPVANGETAGATAEPAAQQPAPVPGGESGVAGATADNMPGLDVDAYGKQLVEGIRNQVIQTKRKEWADKGYRTFSVQDLARRNEQDGSYYYVNPDDGPQNWERPGYRGISRREAQDWCDSFNKELNDKWKSECAELEREMMTNYAPTFRLLSFYPTYQKMSGTEKEIFDELTEDYALKDSAGNITGFSVDLNILARQAKAMSARFASAAPAAAAPQQAPVRQPVVDARSSAGGARQTSTPEFKDINEAIAYYESQKKANRKAGK